MTTVLAPMLPGTTRNRGRWSVLLRPTVIGVGILLALTAVVVTTQSSYNVFIFNSFLLAAIGAIALNLQMGTAGQISMGNSAFLLIGAFTTAAAARWGVAFPLSILIGAVVSGLLGLLIGIPALRLRGLYFALATVSVFFIAHYLAARYQTATVGEAGFLMEPVFTGRQSAIQNRWAWLLLAVLAVVIVVVSTASSGKFGRALRVIRDHPDAAPSFGIGVLTHKLAVLGIGFALIGLQGGLQAYFIGQVTVDAFTLLMSIQYLAMIVIGGMDSVVGSVLGAFVVTLLPVLTTTILQAQIGSESSTVGPQVALILYGILVIVFVTLSPGGIVGWGKTVRHRFQSRQHSKKS